MNPKATAACLLRWAVFTLSIILLPTLSFSQQLKISDFVLFGGNGLCPAGPGQTPCNSPGCAVQIGSSSVINGGAVGSYRLVQTTGGVNIAGNIYSGGTIVLANKNTVSGFITAANSQNLTGTIFSAGSNSVLKKNIDVKGNIAITNGTISGVVTHPVGTTYNGPKPAGGEVKGNPSLPTMPDMPAVTNFPSARDTTITGGIIYPGTYGNITMTGGKTLTLTGPGTYTFKAIKNSGGTNNFVFDFAGNTTGVYMIYIYGDVELDKVQATMKNGGSASRIYSETHGTGSTNSDKTVAWNIANGSSGSNTTKWLGTVWAPYAAIRIGSGSGSSEI
ncbi:MAG: hypothetical protein JNL23_08325, partial [Chitinophagaceae bacterium]|nr:hypothetical protein [Chitinophagaceae bacterium]